MQYFLAVAQEESISAAAEYLHLSQPTLSRQLKELEDELGKQLFIRGNRKITLTEEGMIFKRRCLEITDLVNKTKSEVSLSDGSIAGDIYIGAGETEGLKCVLNIANNLRQSYPLVHFHIISGDAVSVTEQLDRGLIDFGLLLGGIDSSKYDRIKLPFNDTWGVLMKRSSPLSSKESISPSDLEGLPLIISRQQNENSPLFKWLKSGGHTPDIVATYNLAYNASLMVGEGLGYALCLDKIINVQGGDLCFKPLSPRLDIETNLVWKKYQVFGKASDLFLQNLCRCFLP